MVKRRSTSIAISRGSLKLFSNLALFVLFHIATRFFYNFLQLLRSQVYNKRLCDAFVIILLMTDPQQNWVLEDKSEYPNICLVDKVMCF
jgi:hypothetical protein